MVPTANITTNCLRPVHPPPFPTQLLQWSGINISKSKAPQQILTDLGTGPRLVATIIYIGMVKCRPFFPDTTNINFKTDMNHAVLLSVIASGICGDVDESKYEVPGCESEDDWNDRKEAVATSLESFSGTMELQEVQEKLKQAGADFEGALEPAPKVHPAPNQEADELLRAESQGSEDQNDLDDDFFFGTAGSLSA